MNPQTIPDDNADWTVSFGAMFAVFHMFLEYHVAATENVFLRPCDLAQSGPPDFDNPHRS
jgi:hypothetical protein